MDANNIIKRHMDANNIIKRHIEVIEKIQYNIQDIIEVSKLCIRTLKQGNKILVFGNGGSAAEAQHFAAEIVGRFLWERRGFPAIALTSDSAIITAIGNDFSFDDIFSRQVSAICGFGDVCIGISTSGNSKNVANGIIAGKQKGATTVSLLGKDGGSIKMLSDLSIIVNNTETPRIQECHLLIIHMICEIIDQELSK